MNTVTRFRQHIKEQGLFAEKDKLLLAVSGGVDSVVLCELCKQAGFDFSIAHCNFQLRGEESERDELFVRALATNYAATLLTKKFDTKQYAAEHKLSTQEAARNLRYAWFAEIVNNLLQNTLKSAKVLLLTAHHADDNNETVLMNFFRGTGLHGLTGIPAVNHYIRRPLLAFSKEELIAFASENKLSYVEDSSNESSRYTRNFFRNEIIPAISNVYPQVKENIQANITRFKAIEELYRFSVDELKKKICKQKGNETHIPVNLLLSYHNKALIYEMIADYGFTEKQLEEVMKLATSDSGKYIQSPNNTYRLIKHRHWFVISPVRSESAATIIIEASDKEILFALGNLSIEKTSARGHQQGPVGRPETNNAIARLDAGRISFPLLLRKAKTDDYFYPLGMKRKKKINRFLIDQKLSKTEKENAWVIESNQRIIWVVGYRIDERFKITAATKDMLQLGLIPSK